MKRLPDSLSQKDRRYQLWRLSGRFFGAVLVVRVGKVRDVYALYEESAPEFPTVRVFLLEKINRPLPAFGPYCVVVPLSRGEVGDCSCQGFGRWGACKHATCLTDFVQECNEPPID